MRQRPARAAADRAQALLPVEAIDLVDDAVDIEGEVGAAVADAPVIGEHGGEVGAQRRRLVEAKAEAREARAHLPQGRAEGQAILAAHLAPGIGGEAQRPRRGHRRIDLAQAAGGGVARVGI